MLKRIFLFCLALGTTSLLTISVFSANGKSNSEMTVYAFGFEPQERETIIYEQDSGTGAYVLLAPGETYENQSKERVPYVYENAAIDIPNGDTLLIPVDLSGSIDVTATAARVRGYDNGQIFQYGYIADGETYIIDADNILDEFTFTVDADGETIEYVFLKNYSADTIHFLKVSVD